MTRAFLIVMDSVGIGGAPDAGAFFNGTRSDVGASTVAHVAQSRPLHMPVLDALGLGAAVRLSSGENAPGLDAEPLGLWGVATEVSRGKDTPTGHWELAGVPVSWQWTTFPDVIPAFPAELTTAIAVAAGTDGILGNCHASGTEIIARLGETHLRSGWPICYTSVDSVLQIAAHEESFGLDRLLDLCREIAPILHSIGVGRVIARPFTGSPGAFARTPNRRDFARPPPEPTLLDIASAAGRRTHAVGKISDIFSGRGVSDHHHGRSDNELGAALMRLAEDAEAGSLTFANFVEFDSLYGHRRDVAGYASALEWFDTLAGAFLARLRPGDLAIFTADHGNDPTWSGTDHTRERVPVLGHGVGARAIGHVGFVDVGASVAAHLGFALPRGRSFL